MRPWIVCTLTLVLLSSCMQTASQRNYIISQIQEEEENVATEEEVDP